MRQCLQLGKRVDDTVRSIALLASRDDNQSGRMLSARYELTAYDCYESAVELFDERCFDVSQVCICIVYQSVYTNCHLLLISRNI